MCDEPLGEIRSVRYILARENRSRVDTDQADDPPELTTADLAAEKLKEMKEPHMGPKAILGIMLD